MSEILHCFIALKLYVNSPLTLCQQTGLYNKVSEGIIFSHTQHECTSAFLQVVLP